MPSEERPSFEALLDRLEAMVEQLEASDLPLDEALDLYERSVGLAKESHARLAEAERRIERLSRAGTTEPFPTPDGLDEGPA